MISNSKTNEKSHSIRVLTLVTVRLEDFGLTSSSLFWWNTPGTAVLRYYWYHFNFSSLFHDFTLYLPEFFFFDTLVVFPLFGSFFFFLREPDETINSLIILILKNNRLLFEALRSYYPVVATGVSKFGKFPSCPIDFPSKTSLNIRPIDFPSKTRPNIRSILTLDQVKGQNQMSFTRMAPRFSVRWSSGSQTHPVPARIGSAWGKGTTLNKR